MNKFTQGQNLQTRSICDAECIYTGTVIKRTSKTVTVDLGRNELATRRIQLDQDGNEYIFPHGRYSMAAIFRA